MEAVTTFTSAQVCALAGCTYRQLDYWTRLGLVSVSGSPACGSGSRRAFTPADVEQVKVIAARARARDAWRAEPVAV